MQRWYKSDGQCRQNPGLKTVQIAEHLQNAVPGARIVPRLNPSCKTIKLRRYKKATSTGFQGRCPMSHYRVIQKGIAPTGASVVCGFCLQSWKGRGTVETRLALWRLGTTLHRVTS